MSKVSPVKTINAPTHCCTVKMFPNIITEHNTVKNFLKEIVKKSSKKKVQKKKFKNKKFKNKKVQKKSSKTKSSKTKSSKTKSSKTKSSKTKSSIAKKFKNQFNNKKVQKSIQ